jgi:hypothetical protein
MRYSPSRLSYSLETSYIYILTQLHFCLLFFIGYVAFVINVKARRVCTAFIYSYMLGLFKVAWESIYKKNKGAWESIYKRIYLYFGSECHDS